MKRCPQCRREVKKDGNKLFPFCSERCHLIDLGNWLGEAYRIPEDPETAGAVEATTPSTDDERG